MGNKLYVGNVPFAATRESLADHFAQAGTVTDVQLVMDKVTGRPRGFAFITMATEAEAQNAINLLHGRPCDGRTLTVTEARPREERPVGGGGGGPPVRPPPPRPFNGEAGGGARNARGGSSRRFERGGGERDRHERRERSERERGGRRESGGGRRFQIEDYEDDLD